MTAPAPLDGARALAYPPAVERAWVERAVRKVGGKAPAALARLVEPTRALSDLFTTRRPGRFPDYGADEMARLAYGVFFFPQAWVRVRLPLVEALDFRGWRPPADREARILDVGAGIGPAGWGAAHLLVARGVTPRARVVALDRSAASLDHAARVAAACPEEARGIAWEAHVEDVATFGPASRAAQGAPYDLVLASFSMNEALAGEPDARATDWLRALSRVLADDGLLLVVEPALRETSERLRRVARPAVEDGTLVPWGPDLAPALAPPDASGRFWDHEVRRWRPPESLRIVNRSLGRSLEELTFSYVLLGPRPPRPLDPSARLLRLTSPFARTRGRREWTGLASDGGRYGYDLLERTVTPQDATRLRGFERGDVLEAEAVEAHRVPGRFRVPRAAALRCVHHPA